MSTSKRSQKKRKQVDRDIKVPRLDLSKVNRDSDDSDSESDNEEDDPTKDQHIK